MRILIIQTASIGDVILITPLLEGLHQHYPDAELDILLKKGTETLFQDHPFVHKVLIWDKRHHKYQNLIRIIRRIRRSGYDQVINVQRFLSTGLLTLLSGAGTTAGFDKNPLSRFFSHRLPHTIGKKSVHETERNLSLLHHLGIRGSFPVRLYPNAMARQKVAGYTLKPFITLSPSSLWFTKQLPEAKWVELVKGIPDGLGCYILGSGGDAELAGRIRGKSGNADVAVLAGKLSLLESAALMAQARMNYTNDSAPQHLASAMDAPVAVAFCSTVPSFGFGPLSKQSHILETKEVLPCRPCGIHGRRVCPEGHFRCASNIAVSDMLSIL